MDARNVVENLFKRRFQRSLRIL